MTEDMEQRPQTQTDARTNDLPEDGRPADAPGIDLQQHNDEMLRAVTSIDQQVEQIVSWKQRLSEQMDLLRRDSLKVLQWQKRLTDEQSHLKAEADRLASDRADLESQRAAIADEQRLASSELETRRNELESHRADLEARKEQLETEQRRLTQREQAILEREQGLKAEQAELAARSDQFAAERQKLDDRQRELDRMHAELDAAKARLGAEKQVAATELAEDEAALKARRDVLQQRENELAAKLVQLGAEKGQLEGFIIVAEGDVAQSKEKLKELESQRTELEEKRVALEAKNTAIAAQLASAQEQIDELRKRNQALSQENTALASEDENARRAKADLESQAKAVATRADDLEKRAAELEAQRQELIEQHRNAQDRIAELEKRCADLEQSLQAARSTANQAPEPTFRIEPESSESFDDLFGGPEAAPTTKRESEPEPEPRDESEELAAATSDDEQHAAVPDRTQWRAEDQARLHPRQEDLVQAQELQRATPEPEPDTLTLQQPPRRSPVATAVNVIIFAAAVLGLTFGMIYRFFPATYRCEAVVQLVPPADLKAGQVGDWLNRQVEAMPRDGELLNNAWARLQSRSKYDAPEKWLAALPREMELKLEPASRKVAVRMLGDNPEYLASAANAIVDAYADRAARLNRQSNPQGQVKSASVAAHASPPRVPVTDHRMRVALTASASVLFLSLLAMMLIRRKMRRTVQNFDQLPA